tara:strand:- start:1446 stop:1643 length:198 start_codon:yes stop_codon:yes gene_type:complete
MRIIFLALLMSLATQVGADTKKYGKKECNEISAVIDFLLSTTPNFGADMEKTVPTARQLWSYHRL